MGDPGHPGRMANAVPVRDNQTLAAASLTRVAHLALRTGLLLLLATAALGTAVLVAQHGSEVLIAQGALMVAIALAGFVKIDRAARVLRGRGSVCALIAAFCVAGAFERGLGPAYSGVLLALVWISAVVDPPIEVLVCVFVAWGGFAIDVALEGHALQMAHGSVAAQSTGEIAILLISAGMTFAAISILRVTIAGAPASLAAVRDATASSLTPALASTVRGDPIVLLPRGDPVAITRELSPSERAVLALLAEGLAPKQAARELGLAVTTVRSHIASGKRKTGARTLEQLVGLYAEAQRGQ